MLEIFLDHLIDWWAGWRSSWREFVCKVWGHKIGWLKVSAVYPCESIIAKRAFDFYHKCPRCDYNTTMVRRIPYYEDDVLYEYLLRRL